MQGGGALARAGHGGNSSWATKSGIAMLKIQDGDRSLGIMHYALCIMHVRLGMYWTLAFFGKDLMLVFFVNTNISLYT